jgi:hypothetical protein
VWCGGAGPAVPSRRRSPSRRSPVPPRALERSWRRGYACTRRRPGPPALYTAAGMHATRCPLLTHGRPTCNRQRGVRYCRLSRRPAARKVRASRARANQKTAGIQKSGRTFTDALGRPELFRADRWIDARVRVRVHCRCTLPAARAKRSDRHRRWGRPTQGPPRRASGRGGWRCMVVHSLPRQAECTHTTRVSGSGRL